jgi:alpha-glucosidase
VYRELRQLLESYSSTQPRVAIGEVHIFDWEKWAAYYGKNLDEIHLPFNFQLLNIPWTAEAVRQIVDTQEASIPPGAWPNYVLGNHDEPRLATRLGLPGARLAAMLLLTLRGTPTLYYGDEIGMTDGQIPPDLQQDPLSARVPGLGRDPCRTPMQWTPGKNAGFSSSNTSRLWLPVTNNYSVVNVERQLTDPGSILNLYRQLLAYRKKSQALQAGQYLPVDKVPSGCFAYLRRMEGGDGVFIMLNFNAHQVEVQIPEFKKGCLKLSTHMDRAEEIDFSGWVLRGNEGVIIDLH